MELRDFSWWVLGAACLRKFWLEDGRGAAHAQAPVRLCNVRLAEPADLLLATAFALPSVPCYSRYPAGCQDNSVMAAASYGRLPEGSPPLAPECLLHTA